MCDDNFKKKWKLFWALSPFKWKEKSGQLILHSDIVIFNEKEIIFIFSFLFEFSDRSFSITNY